ncbi:aldehyde dehydrogenase family protein [Pseudomonas citronellolis]|uniref:aldehyde dehydrogenase family protein n=1 Tax=Pseudomonas citronellolis TaxID=53408 RepID=UPI000853AAFA|nr:aldehyde dehydrogenase family protein [Pseudomonas humi]
MNNKIAMGWINGEWVDSDRHVNSIDPATSEVIGSYADAGLEEARSAVRAASQAFSSSDWKHDRLLRAKVLTEMADLFEQRSEQIIRQLVRENGKTLHEAGFEVSMVAPKLRYFAAQTLTNAGRSLQPAAGKYSFVVREAIGVVGIIVPWNSPVILLVRSLAPALAAGACAVVKMPGQTAQTNALLAQLLADVPSLPRGVVNLFSESGSEGAKYLVESPQVPAISFTGSTYVGRSIAATGGRYLKRLNLELGGKSPMIIFDDADLESLIPTLEKAITVFAGQFCMTGSRILAQRGIAEQIRQRLAQRLEAVRVGPGSDPNSDMGAMIDKANVERVESLVERAITEGARVIVRGGPIREGELAHGAFYRPTLLEVDDNQAAIVQTETFGPVATLQVFDSEAEAVDLANSTEFGLAASIWSRDVDRSWRVGQAVEAGTIWINEWAVIHDECEEGGYKQSGLGRLNGLAALDAFSEYKHFTLSPGQVRA